MIELKKYFLFTLLCLCTVDLVFAQNSVKFTGKIVDKSNGTKIELASVQIKELNRWTTSDIQGNFIFDRIPVGNYTIQVEHKNR